MRAGDSERSAAGFLLELKSSFDRAVAEEQFLLSLLLFRQKLNFFKTI